MARDILALASVSAVTAGEEGAPPAQGVQAAALGLPVCCPPWAAWEELKGGAAWTSTLCAPFLIHFGSPGV